LGVPEIARCEYLKFPTIITDEVREKRQVFQKRLLASSISAEMQARQCIIVASGSVDIRERVANAIVFANGNVRIADSLWGSLIICNGDVEVETGAIERSVILCRGTLTAGRSLIRDSVIERNERNPLGLFKFFELAQVGLAVDEVKKELRVASVDNNNPFARAGLKSGDVILALQDAKVASVEDFRNRLRARYLAGEATLSVRRGTAEIGIRVSFRD
jgi:hypothetical protein